MAVPLNQVLLFLRFGGYRRVSRLHTSRLESGVVHHAEKTEANLSPRTVQKACIAHWKIG